MKFETKWKAEIRPALQSLSLSQNPFISRKTKTLAAGLIVNIDKVLKGEKQQFVAMFYLCHRLHLLRLISRFNLLPLRYKQAFRFLVPVMTEICREYNKPKPYLIPLKLREC